MYMTSEVFFDIYGDAFYVWNTNEICKHLQSEQILVKNAGNMKHTREMERDFRAFCTGFAQIVHTPYYLDKKTYDITLARRVYIKDEADKKYYQSHKFNGEIVKFILVPDGKLIYPADIKNALKVPHYFKNIISPKPLDGKMPVFIEEYDMYFAHVRNFTPGDIVLDTHGRYLWAPDENLVGQKCPYITDLLKQRREKVYCK